MRGFADSLDERRLTNDTSNSFYRSCRGNKDPDVRVKSYIAVGRLPRSGRGVTRMPSALIVHGRDKIAAVLSVGERNSPTLRM